MNCFNPNCDASDGQMVISDWMGVRVACVCGCNGPSVSYSEAYREIKSKESSGGAGRAEVQSSRESLAWARWRDLVALVNPEVAA